MRSFRNPQELIKTDLDREVLRKVLQELKEEELFGIEGKIHREMEFGKKAIAKEQKLYSEKFREWTMELKTNPDEKDEILEILNDKIKEVGELIKFIYDDYEDGFKKNIPFWLRKGMFKAYKVEEKERLLKRLLWQKQSLIFTNNNRTGVSEEEIQQAMGFPISELIKVNKNGFARCVNHLPDKHPSMLCKKNFAYCFTCGYTGSVISVYMKIQGVAFVDAVKFLNGREKWN